MPLTDTFLKTIKYSRDDNKPQREYDTEGLYVEITPKGVKKWQMKYKRPITGKENRLSFGIYPEVSLKEAREKRDNARKLLKDGTDPSEAKKEEKRLSVLQAANTFEAITNEWLNKQSHLSEATRKKSAWLLSFAVNSFGQKRITDISKLDVLAVCFIFENQNKRETAKRIKVKCGQVFRYAIATGRASYEPTQALKGALQPVITNHQAAITDPSQVARLMQDIHGYEGHYITIFALKLAPLVFVRPSELRTAKWADIDLNAKEWRYHVHKTKTEHIVPLSSQAVKLLTDLKSISSNSPYVFPSIRTNERPMSENTINAALRRLGYTSEQMCGHGF
ncbi:MAG TPA: integrase arm-type DNA-binding domain-containing protein, partial [Agitococcus sp.]|nr:integrase arm-type DNA-binding domain-containing protein [Agitococcus sp.]